MYTLHGFAKIIFKTALEIGTHLEIHFADDKIWNILVKYIT